MQAQQTLRLPALAAPGYLARLTARVLGAWQRQSERRATFRTLNSLDDRTLHDLGLYRSEIGAISAEIGGQVEPSHLRALLAHHLRA